MADVLSITRKIGDRKPISVKVTYPTSYNLSGLPVAFWMDAKDGTAKVAGASGSATDITPSGQTVQTVWRLSYTPGANDLDAIGSYKAEFAVDFGAGIEHYYPDESDIVVKVISHPASS